MWHMVLEFYPNALAVFLLPNCGDGVVDAGEVCDDGNTVPGDTCNENCRIEKGSPEPPDEPGMPTVSEWGMAVVILLLLAGMTIKFGLLRPRKAA